MKGHKRGVRETDASFIFAYGVSSTARGMSPPCLFPALYRFWEDGRSEKIQAIAWGSIFLNFPLTRTVVRYKMVIEQTFYLAVRLTDGAKGGLLMTGWTLFFLVIGAAVLTAQLFRVIDAIEHPRRTR